MESRRLLISHQDLWERLSSLYGPGLALVAAQLMYRSHPGSGLGPILLGKMALAGYGGLLVGRAVAFVLDEVVLSGESERRPSRRQNLLPGMGRYVRSCR